MNDPSIHAVLAHKIPKQKAHIGGGPTKIQEWTDIVKDIYVKEKITFSLCLQKNVFIKFWTKGVEYVKPLLTDFVEVLNK